MIGWFSFGIEMLNVPYLHLSDAGYFYWPVWVDIWKWVRHSQRKL